MSIKLATFGGGCFWGMEKFFRKEFPKLKNIKTGYAGGIVENPSYTDVCKGNTEHAEVIHMKYDTTEIDYKDLVRFFWRVHDPTTKNRQGNDIGTQYRSVIFYHDDDQKNDAYTILKEIEEKKVFKDPIVTDIIPFKNFYEAEEYHQDYLTKNPDGYCNHKLYW